MATATTTDYYAILGVARTATAAEIKKAYRKLARKYHPDVNPGAKAAEDKFKRIQEAYGVLNDPEKRKIFDQFGFYREGFQGAGGADSGFPGGGTGRGGGFEGFDFSNFGNFEGGGGFADIFSNIFDAQNAAGR